MAAEQGARESTGGGVGGGLAGGGHGEAWTEGGRSYSRALRRGEAELVSNKQSRLSWPPEGSLPNSPSEATPALNQAQTL